MYTKWLRVVFCTLTVLVTATIGFCAPPTPQQALEYAKSVVLVQRVVRDNQIRSYVKEVWRLDPNAGAPPPIGSEYGSAIPYDPQMRHPERDGIVFGFGENRPKGLPIGWRAQVMENGMVYPFEMDVNAVRTAVKNTTPKE
jgi:hypothetical protein